MTRGTRCLIAGVMMENSLVNFFVLQAGKRALCLLLNL